MAYKQPSSGPFKMLGSSPAKQDVKQVITQGVSKNINTPNWATTTVTTSRPGHYNHDITTLNKTGQITSEGGGTPNGSTSTKKTTTQRNYPNNPDHTKRSYDIKIKKASTASKVIKTGKTILSKASKFLGGKTLGVAGMLMATSSKADQPKFEKSEGEQIKHLLTKHKLKGGRQ